MADTTTTNLSLTKPEVGASTDTWGTKINTDLDTIDALFDAGPVLKVAKGGTGAATASGARTALGLGTVATENTVPVDKGGTGSTTLTANSVLLGNGTSALQAVAPSTSGNVLTSNGTTWTSAAPPSGGVTSAVAGNGVAVSAATGAVTFSAACPTFNTVGSYVYGTLGTSAATAGTNYSAGASNGQVKSASIFIDCSGTTTITNSNNLSGTWKAMGGNVSSPFGATSLFCRVS